MNGENTQPFHTLQEILNASHDLTYMNASLKSIYIYIYVDQKTVALCLLSDLTCNYEKEVVRSSFIEAQMARPMGMRRCSANDTGVVKIFSYVYI